MASDVTVAPALKRQAAPAHKPSATSTGSSSAPAALPDVVQKVITGEALPMLPPSVAQAVAATLLALYLARVRRSAPLERLREIAERSRKRHGRIKIIHELRAPRKKRVEAIL